jgi:hypothetical protein
VRKKKRLIFTVVSVCCWLSFPQGLITSENSDSFKHWGCADWVAHNCWTDEYREKTVLHHLVYSHLHIQVLVRAVRTDSCWSGHLAADHPKVSTSYMEKAASQASPCNPHHKIREHFSNQQKKSKISCNLQVDRRLDGDDRTHPKSLASCKTVNWVIDNAQTHQVNLFFALDKTMEY